MLNLDNCLSILDMCRQAPSGLAGRLPAVDYVESLYTFENKIRFFD